MLGSGWWQRPSRAGRAGGAGRPRRAPEVPQSSPVGEIHFLLSRCHVTLNPLNEAPHCWRGPQKAIPEAHGPTEAIFSAFP